MDVKMMSSSEQEDKEYVEELERFLTIAKHPGVVALLKTNIATAKRASLASHAQLPASNQTSKKTSGEKHMGSAIKIKEYGWDQSNKFVKIYISNIPTVEKVDVERIHRLFSERHFNVEIPVESKVYVLTMKDLLHSIIPDQCSIKVKSGMITILLRKKMDQSWDCLLLREKKAGKENDSSLSDKGEDPGAGLMKLMKKMYDDGDDEMKRTISKSWYEAQQKRGSGVDEM